MLIKIYLPVVTTYVAMTLYNVIKKDAIVMLQYYDLYVLILIGYDVEYVKLYYSWCYTFGRHILSSS